MSIKNLDLSYLKRFGKQILQNKTKIENVLSGLNSQASVTDQFLAVKSIFGEFEKIEHSDASSSTFNWEKKGFLLCELKEAYEADQTINKVEDSWAKICSEHFPMIKTRRRQQAMQLWYYKETHGENLEKLYFLGIDNLNIFLNALYAKNESLKAKDVLKIFNVSVEDISSNEDSKINFKSKVNEICRYLRCGANTDDLGADQDLYYRVIAVGCEFKDADHKLIKSLGTQTEKETFLKQAIANRAIPREEKSRAIKVQSTLDLLIKFSDNVSSYNGQKLPVPQYILQSIVEDAEKSLAELKSMLREGDKNAN